MDLDQAVVFLVELVPFHLEVVDIRKREIILLIILRIIEPVQNNGHKEIEEDNPKQHLKRDHIRRGAPLPAAHILVQNPRLVIENLVADEVRLLLADDVIHNKVSSLASGDSEKKEEG